MNSWLVILRAVHYATAMLLFGEILFALVVMRPVFDHARDSGVGADLQRRLRKVARVCLLAGVMSGAAWFAIASVEMSGLPFSRVMDGKTVGLILGTTVFGQVLASRAALLLALVAALVFLFRTRDEQHRFRLELATLVLAAAYLASLAGAGHAVAGDESGNLSRIGIDMAHLLAAGGWLGALPALVFVLGHTRTRDLAARVAQRFSTLGLVCVALLIATGTVNSWYQVGSFPALVGTPYGRLLLAKLVLFAAMLGFASVNRGLTMRLENLDDQEALRWLRRNAVAEVVFGTGVIAIVAALGVLVPAVHDPIIWPFDHTLSFDHLRQSSWMQLGVVAAGATACISLFALVAGALAHPQKFRLAAAAGFTAAFAIYTWLLVAPAHPTTYLVSPVPYGVEPIAAGATLYKENCSSCHGLDGRRNAGETSSTDGTQLNLNDVTRERRAGDLFWSIAHGIPATQMPEFGKQLDETGIWRLVQYLDAQTAAQHALTLSGLLKPVPPVPAPEFTFEIANEFPDKFPNSVVGRQQESLWQQRGTRIPLLVFYTLPSSLPRLQELAGLAKAYSQAGAMIIAIPMSKSGAGSTPASTPGLPGSTEPIFAVTRPAVAATYAMFARVAQDGEVGAVEHVEYLVDRFSSIRARWIGVPEAGSQWSAQMLRQIDVLVHEPPRPPLQWGHRH